jgi:hypothetical protein
MGAENQEIANALILQLQAQDKLKDIELRNLNRPIVALEFQKADLEKEIADENLRSELENQIIQTNKILNETIESKANDLTEKLKLNKSEEFDYVEEGETCEQCGSEMTEGECNECGTKNEEIIYELEVDEEEMDESSEFTYAALQAKKKGKTPKIEVWC